MKRLWAKVNKLGEQEGTKGGWHEESIREDARYDMLFPPAIQAKFGPFDCHISAP
jgi:hypothetical protein